MKREKEKRERKEEGRGKEERGMLNWKKLFHISLDQCANMKELIKFDSVIRKKYLKK